MPLVGHNYKNDQFFSRLSELNIGDKVYLTPNKGKDMIYLVYDKYEIAENDMEKLGLRYIELNLSVIQCLQKDFIENVVALHLECRPERIETATREIDSGSLIV